MKKRLTRKAINEFKEHLGLKVGGKWVKGWSRRWQKKRKELFERWYQQTGEAGEVYPSQGLMATAYDRLNYLGKTLVNEQELWVTLQQRDYILSILNHPVRIEALRQKEKQQFIPVPAVTSGLMAEAKRRGLALSVGDLGAVVVGTEGRRVGRRDLLATGPFVKLGQHARVPFVGSAMPDIFGSPAAVATAAASLMLVGVPRNGVFAEVKRQVDLVRAAYAWMETEPLLEGRAEAKELIKLWRRQVMGVLEPELRLGYKRAKKLYRAGVRAFRIYSPEPGKDAVELTKRLRQELGPKVELFCGQVASVTQAAAFEAAGADGLYVGIGGGGRCLTAWRSGSVVDWPILLWELRGQVGVPVIVEGGASDHVGITLLLGATGIGVSRIGGGGTIESPGGLLYWVGRDGHWFKPYGGEASARTKFADGIMLPLGIPAFVEGETTKALKSYIAHIKPTMAANGYFLLEDLIIALVFRGVLGVEALQALDPSPLRQITADGRYQQQVHE